MSGKTAIDPFATLLEHGVGLASGAFSAVDLAGLYLDRIERLDSKLHSFVSIDREGALAAARESDRRRAAGQTLGPLDGLPIAVKDLCEIDGEITTFGSAAWLEHRSTDTSDVVHKLRVAGMVLLGKTHMVEFAFGGWGVNPVMGTPWNPWDMKEHRVPGGSSSGSAVAVAAGLAPAAIGSDTGGSVRGPAALNGITGLKTTAGLVSLRHTLALSATLDSIGPMCRTAADAALLTVALADTTIPANELVARELASLKPPADLRGVRIIALRQEDFPSEVQLEVLAAFLKAQEVFRTLGAELVDRRLPYDMADLARRNGELIAAEAWSVHRAYVENMDLPLGEWVRKRVVSGKTIGQAQYDEILVNHRALCAEWKEWMTDAHALMTPTVPMVACRLGEVEERITPMGAFTRAGNYFGACAVSLPAGHSTAGLPIGLQLMAKPMEEGTLLMIAEAFQQATPWHLRTPALEDPGR